MPIAGYDPADVDERLRELLEEWNAEELLSPEQERRLEAGESLLEVLTTDQLRELVRTRPTT
ncbi:hypothetical protein [Natronomonas sp. EA1]|uniref:hypothetical protein n=1 Tax=Natronomonas sp. EA1 TaxID=3421655 RepID=UPI003EB7CD34